MLLFIYIIFSLALVTHQTPIPVDCSLSSDCTPPAIEETSNSTTTTIANEEVQEINRRRAGAQAAVELGSQAGQELISIASNKLQNFLNNINAVALDRGQFTKMAIAHFKAVTRGRKNILVIDNKWPNLVDVGKAYLKIHVEVPKPVTGTHGFDIYLFDQGIVTKMGDGGFTNWRYYGNAKKIDGDSKNIRFNKIG